MVSVTSSFYSGNTTILKLFNATFLAPENYVISRLKLNGNIEGAKAISTNKY